MSIAIWREIPDRRIGGAVDNPVRGVWQELGGDPLDHRLECQLGRLRLGGFLSTREYDAGCKWRTIYHNWLKAIEAPDDLSDETAGAYERTFKDGEAILMKGGGRRVFDAVCAIAYYETPEELGGFYFVARDARKGLRVLADFL